MADSLQWASNITAFSVISGSHFMYVTGKNLKLVTDYINQVFGNNFLKCLLYYYMQVRW